MDFGAALDVLALDILKKKADIIASDSTVDRFVKSFDAADGGLNWAVGGSDDNAFSEVEFARFDATSRDCATTFNREDVADDHDAWAGGLGRRRSGWICLFYWLNNVVIVAEKFS